MAIDISLMCGEPVETEVKGRVFKFSPTNIGDLAYMQDWFVDEPIENACADIKKCGEHMDKEEKSELLKAAREESNVRRKVVRHLETDKAIVERVTDDMNSLFSSISGIIRFMWLSIRKEHPEIKMDELTEYVDAGTAGYINELIAKISFEEQDEDHELQYVAYDPEKKTAD